MGSASRRTSDHPASYADGSAKSFVGSSVAHPSSRDGNSSNIALAGVADEDDNAEIRHPRARLERRSRCFSSCIDALR